MTVPAAGSVKPVRSGAWEVPFTVKARRLPSVLERAHRVGKSVPCARPGVINSYESHRASLAESRTAPASSWSGSPAVASHSRPFSTNRREVRGTELGVVLLSPVWLPNAAIWVTFDQSGPKPDSPQGMGTRAVVRHPVGLRTVPAARLSNRPTMPSLR